MNDVPPLNTRPATGAVSAPLVLLEGEEKAGKSWQIALLSASPRVGRLLWLDLGEGSGDEYGAIEGASYEVVIHDGSHASILGQIRAARAEAQRRLDAGEPPLVFALDSATHLWESQKSWIDGRARRREKNRKKLEADPNAEIELTTDLWNDATGRWRQIMTLLMTFPSPVVVTARGKEVAEIGKDGKPTGATSYRVEGQKGLAYDSSVWIRMTRENGAKVVGARSVHLGIRPGEKPQKLPSDWTLDGLIFDDLRYEGGNPRDLQETGAAVEERADAEDLREEALTRGKTREDLLALYGRAKGAGLLDTEVWGADQDDEPITLGALIVARGEALKNQRPQAVPDQPADEQGRAA